MPVMAGPANQPATKTTSGTAGGNGPNGASIIVGTPQSADIERSVTAAYTVPAGTFLDSFEGVITRAVNLGGYVASSATNPDEKGRITSGSVTLKIPAPKIADFLNGMPASFVASSIDFSSIDHTAQFVDVNARLSSAHAHLDALNHLLGQATSLNDIVNLEQQIESVQAEIDTDQGQLNVLTASVELATATIQLTERGATVTKTPSPGPLSGGIASGWNNAVQVTGAVLEGVVTAFPLLVVALAAWLVWRRFGRAAIPPRRPEPTEDVVA